ncbi:MAG TPA: M20/M25/M40 family metallo-hydrolase [Thermomicrobiales bacterium]|nr:M20/M25/M40 family metallo-hydrolase [Thermomicrobiales bacterium]
MTPSQRQLERVRATATELLDAVAERAKAICDVPAPTGAEAERATYVASLLTELGYTPETDDTGNVYARRGSKGGKVVMLAAHTDTVFPATTNVSVRREGDRLHGPGVGDNSLGVSAMLGVLQILDRLSLETDVDIIVAATVGEEGLGNLRGIRAAVERYRDDLGAVIAVEGHNLGRVTHAGVGSTRWRVRVTGPGGHSWGAFGKPNAIHGLSRIIAELAELDVPSDPKTTYNVGTIEGGTSVNTIAPDASALVDMRSVDAGALRQLVDRVGEIVATAAGDGLTADVEVLGERPAGVCPRSHPLVGAAGTVLRQVGFEPVFDASSTDANIPISLGIPAVCIGITHGGLGHTTSEFIEVPPIATGLTQLGLLTLAAASVVADNKS